MYTNWEEQALDSLTAIKWYPVTVVVDYLNSLRRYLINTPGKISDSYIPMLGSGIEEETDMQVLPAKKNQRFPPNTFYICEAIGSWGLKLDNIALLTNIMINTNRLERKYPNINSPGDLEDRAFTLMHNLMRMIQDRTHFINRSKFEARYNLSWTTSHAHPELNSVSIDNHILTIKEEANTNGSGSNTPTANSSMTNSDQRYCSVSQESTAPTIDLTQE
jgi:hypothetical protein